MPIMRTITKTAKEYKEKDPYTQVTASTLRRWVKEGSIPSVKVGRTTLINVESLEAFLRGGAYADR